MTMVAVEGVGFTAGASTILSGIDLAIEPDSSVALVGPSGAGKTTLLRIIAGQLAPTAGTVVVDGVQPHAVDVRSRAELVGLVPQGLGLVPRLSVRSNLQAGLAGRMGVIRTLAALVLPFEVDAVREVAQTLAIEEHLDRNVRDISGGEQQRVAIGRMLLQRPRVALADEPVASVDPALAETVIDLLGAVPSSGTFIASLHSPDIAIRRFKRVVALSQGTIAFDLPADQVDVGALGRLYGRWAT